MTQTARRLAIAFAAAAGLTATAHAELFTKAYEFKANTILKVGTDMPAGLRLDSVEFIVPAPAAEKSTFGGPKAKVSISNLSKSSTTVAIAIAVTDADGRLVGVATGGTKLFPLRADRQMVYSLDFGGVNAELDKGTVFRISIEPKP
jgi:hypothetical protein